MKTFSSLLMVLALCTAASAAATPAVWSSPTSATFNGINVTAFTSASAPYVGTGTNRFATTGSWDAGLALDPSAVATVAATVNGGDWQRFVFSAPTEGLFYIENFDSSSVATVTAVGLGTSLNLVSGSSSISYTANAANDGKLKTSNTSFNGEGDAVFSFSGPVSQILVQYSNGVGDNGVFYTFAEPAAPAPAAVPEPTSMMVMAGLFGMFGSVAYFRRKKQS